MGLLLIWQKKLVKLHSSLRELSTTPSLLESKCASKSSTLPRSTSPRLKSRRTSPRSTRFPSNKSPSMDSSSNSVVADLPVSLSSTTQLMRERRTIKSISSEEMASSRRETARSPESKERKSRVELRESEVPLRPRLPPLVARRSADHLQLFIYSE